MAQNAKFTDLRLKQPPRPMAFAHPHCRAALRAPREDADAGSLCAMTRGWIIRIPKDTLLLGWRVRRSGCPLGG
jgi:hypothetical protein